MARKSVVSAAILDLMGRSRRHAWTFEELHEALAAEAAAPDFSSVFRAAEKLAGEGRIRKIVLEDGRARFELATAHHDHLHCTRCGTLVAVPCAFDAASLTVVAAKAGIEIVEHSVVFRGFCASCREFAAGEART